MRQKNWFATCSLSLAMASFWVLSASGNILLNSGFESGTGGDAADWGEIVGGPSGTVVRSSDMPNSGSFSAYMAFDHINNQAAGAAYFIEQNLGANTIDNTLNYNLSFWAKSESTDFTGTDMFAQIQWLDQDGSDGGGLKGETLVSLVGLGLNTGYQQFFLNDLDAADGSDSFLLRFQVSAGAVNDIANGMYIDDASLAAAGAVPEPSAFCLLAAGGIGLVLRRRRS